MADYTTNFSLRKPDPTLDYINVDLDINNNLDIIDSKLKEIDDYAHVVTLLDWDAKETRLNTTTFTDSAYCSQAVAAYSSYLIRGVLAIGSDAAGSGPDIKIDFTYPPGSFSLAMSAMGPHILDTGATAERADIVNLQHEYDSGSPSPQFEFSVLDTADGVRSVFFNGMLITGGTAGSFTLRFAQRVLDAVDNVYIAKGSFFILEKIQ